MALDPRGSPVAPTKPTVNPYNPYPPVAAPVPNAPPVAGAGGGGGYDNTAITDIYTNPPPAGGVAGGANTSGSPPPATPDPGLLSGPGPYEQWAADHQNEFAAPGATENLYTDHGQDLMNTKSYAEQLYEQGSGQMDPYYDYAQKQATQSINDAAAARGGFNSSAAIYDIGNSTANLRGQQAMQMGARATAADASKHSRYNDSFSMANDSDSAHTNRVDAAKNIFDDWQTKEENRLGGGLNNSEKISSDKAALITSMYKNAGDLSNKDNLEAFNAQLQKLGIDPTSAFVKDLISAAGTAGKAAASGGAGGAA